MALLQHGSGGNRNGEHRVASEHEPCLAFPLALSTAIVGRVKYRDRVARDIEKQEAAWRLSFDRKASSAIQGRPPQVTILIEGAVGNIVIGPATTTASRFEYAVKWFGDHGYRLAQHQQGMGAHAWTAVFELPKD